jgi:hypothetical protein
MGRPAKFSNADDLINNCTVKNDCFIWPIANLPSPLLSPTSPLARKVGTNSVTRILFILCRYLPASTRLVKWCNTPFCVNPYHHSENRGIMNRRLRKGTAGSAMNLLPEQESTRHLFPSDAELLPLRPVDPTVNQLLAATAALAGFDARNMPQNRLLARGVPTAEEGKPVLVMKSLVEKQQREEVAEAESVDAKDDDDFWNALNAQAGAMVEKSKEREVVDYTKHLARNSYK